MQRNKKVRPILRQKKKLRETFPEEVQTLGLLDKDCKSTVLNMLKKLKEIMNKELKEPRRTMSQKTENNSTVTLFIG